MVLMRSFFFFNDTATTEIYTLSLHDALPILTDDHVAAHPAASRLSRRRGLRHHTITPRSEEHTSELQSHLNLVCRLLLEKKKKTIRTTYATYCPLLIGPEPSSPTT